MRRSCRECRSRGSAITSNWREYWKNQKQSSANGPKVTVPTSHTPYRPIAMAPTAVPLPAHRAAVAAPMPATALPVAPRGVSHDEPRPPLASPSATAQSSPMFVESRANSVAQAKPGSSLQHRPKPRQPRNPAAVSQPRQYSAGDERRPGETSRRLLRKNQQRSYASGSSTADSGVHIPRVLEPPLTAWPMGPSDTYASQDLRIPAANSSGAPAAAHLLPAARAPDPDLTLPPLQFALPPLPPPRIGSSAVPTAPAPAYPAAGSESFPHGRSSGPGTASAYPQAALQTQPHRGPSSAERVQQFYAGAKPYGNASSNRDEGMDSRDSLMEGCKFRMNNRRE